MSRNNKIFRGAAKLLVWFILLIVADRILFGVLATGFDKYFGLDKQNEIVFIGNSRTALGVDHRLIEKQTGVRCAKFALNGANANNRLAMAKHALATQTECQAIVFDVSGYSFNDRNLSAAAYTLLYPYLDSEPIGQHINDTAVDWSEPLIRQLFCSTRFNSTTLGLAVRGWLGRDDNLKFSSVDMADVQHRINVGNVQSLLATEDGKQLFLDTIDTVSNQDRKIVLLHLPVVKLLNDQDRVNHDANILIMQNIADSNPNVFYLDYNTPNESNLEIMHDGIHLNANGKKVISEKIANELSTLVLAE
jgi:hypothetical protein